MNLQIVKYLIHIVSPRYTQVQRCDAEEVCACTIDASTRHSIYVSSSRQVLLFFFVSLNSTVWSVHISIGVSLLVNRCLGTGYVHLLDLILVGPHIIHCVHPFISPSKSTGNAGPVPPDLPPWLSSALTLLCHLPFGLILFTADNVIFVRFTCDCFGLLPHHPVNSALLYCLGYRVQITKNDIVISYVCVCNTT